MTQWHLYLAFYKSTIGICYGISATVAIGLPLTAPGLLLEDIMTSKFLTMSGYLFAVSLMSIGLLSTFLYKELTRLGEYYFYFNRAITKVKLFGFCLAVNYILGISFIIFTSFYGASA